MTITYPVREANCVPRTPGKVEASVLQLAALKCGRRLPLPRPAVAASTCYPRVDHYFNSPDPQEIAQIRRDFAITLIRDSRLLFSGTHLAYVFSLLFN